MIRSPASSSSESSAMAPRVGSPAGTISQTIRGASRAWTSSARLATSRTSGSKSKPTTSWPFSRSRAAMLPPILPRPTMPSFIVFLPLCRLWICGPARGSAGEPHRHDQVAVVRAGLVVGGLPADDRRLGRGGELQPGDVGVDRVQAVQQEAGVEGDLDVVALQCGLQHL